RAGGVTATGAAGEQQRRRDDERRGTRTQRVRTSGGAEEGGCRHRAPGGPGRGGHPATWPGTPGQDPAGSAEADRPRCPRAPWYASVARARTGGRGRSARGHPAQPSPGAIRPARLNVLSPSGVVTRSPSAISTSPGNHTDHQPSSSEASAVTPSTVETSTAVTSSAARPTTVVIGPSPASRAQTAPGSSTSTGAVPSSRSDGDGVRAPSATTNLSSPAVEARHRTNTPSPLSTTNV